MKRTGAWLLAGAGCAAVLPASAAERGYGLKATLLTAAPLGDVDGDGARDGASSRAAVNLTAKLPAGDADLRADIRVRVLREPSMRRTDVDVRELTAGWRWGDAALTVGAQQVNWGRMDILRITDLINPVDQHDLFREEMPEAKLALWMANWEWQQGARAVQVIVTPQLAADRPLERVGGLPVRVSRPSNSLAQGTIGLRHGFEVDGWSADVVAVHGWRSTPRQQLATDEQGPFLAGQVLRQDSLGFSADKPFGSLVLRLEGLVARIGENDVGSDPQAGPGRTRSAALGAGLDWRSGPWFVAGQLIAVRETGGPGLQSDVAYASMIVQRHWLQDRLSGRALHIRESRQGSSWTSLQAAYELSPRLVVQLQADRFAGDAAGAFGALRERSRVALSGRVAF